MSVYTKNGDRGTTELVNAKNVSKSDDRIQLVGTIDELTSHIGLVKTMLNDKDTIRILEKIQTTLITVMSGVADSYNREYKINDDKTEILEEEIDRLEALFNRPKEFILPGKCHLSAEIDIARTVARRAERALATVSVRFGADTGAKKYMNRLADYLYVLARYVDATEAGEISTEPESTVVVEMKNSAEPKNAAETGSGVVMEQKQNSTLDETVIQEVIKRLGALGKISLDSAKRLIDIVEEEAKRRGKKAVIAVCDPGGNPIAVHAMDGAFIVSFNVAMKKAYTAVGVQMSTYEFGKLAQPGGTFYGVEAIQDGNMIIFGGGVPIKIGETIIGGLGISGGTGEEDHSLAEYGLSRLHEVL